MCEKKPYCNNKIDNCLQKYVEGLHDAGFKTVSCCCGHSKYPKTVLIKTEFDFVWEIFSNTKIPVKNGNRYYKRDSEGIYYIPEVIDKPIDLLF